LLINILKSKIHRATVTGADIHYMGSITIDQELMEHARILPFEKVLVASLDSGQRLETYVIKGKRGGRDICLNGAAARKILKGDKVIILSFAQMEEEKAKNHRPHVVYVDKDNNIISEIDDVKKDDEC
jgi:aspartate 1-decarboxylase